MSGLRHIQQEMASVVMQPLTRSETTRKRTREGALTQRKADSIIKPNDRLTSFERLEIYNRQYWFRLCSSFEEDFPGLQAIAGRKAFERLMIAYLTECPSTSFSLRNLGSHLESWLSDHRNLIEPRVDLALDMVRLEWAHIEAFDSASDPSPAAEELAAVDGASKFRLQPYLKLLQLHYPVDDLVIDLRDHAGSTDTASNSAAVSRRSRIVRRVADLVPEEIWIAVHRHENSVFYKRLHQEDFLMLQAIASGAALEEAIESGFAASAVPEDDRPAFLQEAFQGWAALGWFTQAGLYTEQR